MLATALVGALVLTGVAAWTPSTTFASTTLVTKCGGVSLRTRPRTSAHRVAKLPKGAKVVAVKVVKKGHWKTRCGGIHTGRKWYRITKINGKSVSKLYGVKYVYASKSLFKVKPKPTPTPTPVAAHTVTVPSSIDASGGSDASTALNAFIKSTPDGTTIVFKSGATYRLDQGLVLTNRHNLVLEGNGATLRANNAGSTWLGGPVNLFRGNSYITIRDFKLVGNNGNTTTVYNPGQENQHGVGIWGGSHIEVADNTISRTNGDGVYVSSDDATHASADTVWIHDNTFSYVGRSAIALTAGSHVTIEHNSFDKIGYHVFDVEPDFSYQQVTDVTIRSNTIGSYSHTTAFIGFFFQVYSPASPTVRNITVTGNQVAGIAHEGYDGAARGMNVKVIVPGTSNITVTNNTATQAAPGPILYFANVNGVTATGNSQPLSSGSLAQFSNCTNVTGP